MPTAAELIDPATLMRIRSLEFRARIVVEGFLRGIHRSPYHGFSAEFTEYRQYIPGEDTRYMDWRLYARSDRFYIKKFEDETNLRCHFLVDRSSSMAYTSSAYTKADYGSTLAATLAYFLSMQGDAFGLATFDESLADYIPPRNRPGHLRQFMLALEGAPKGRSTNLVTPLSHLAEILNRRGVIVLISDLLAPLEDLGRELGKLRARGHEVYLFQILDPLELKLDFDGPLILQDMETEIDLHVDPQKASTRYLENLNAHLEGIREICTANGIQYQLLSSNEPLEFVLLEFLNSRSRRSRSSRVHR